MRVKLYGYGVVGKNVYKQLKDYCDLVVVDPNALKGNLDGIMCDHPEHAYFMEADVSIVCVPTEAIVDPLTGDKRLDTTIVEAVAMKDCCDTILIKSALNIGDYRRFFHRLEPSKSVIISPEFYGATQHAISNPDFLILGAMQDTIVQRERLKKVIDLFYSVYTGFNSINIVDPEIANIVKMAENTYLAMQVTFFSAIYKLCDEMGLEYETLRGALLMDKRISPTHSLIRKEAPYWNSHCLNKDVPAYADALRRYNVDASLIDGIIVANEVTMQNVYDERGDK